MKRYICSVCDVEVINIDKFCKNCGGLFDRSDDHFKIIEKIIETYFKKHPSLGKLVKGNESKTDFGESHYYTIINSPFIIEKIRISNHSTGRARMTEHFSFQVTVSGKPNVRGVKRCLDLYFKKYLESKGKGK